MSDEAPTFGVLAELRRRTRPPTAREQQRFNEAAAIARELGRTFAPKTVEVRWFHPFLNDDHRGYCYHDERPIQVFIRADLDDSQAVNTAAHELEHAWCEFNGITNPYESEDRARAFGDLVEQRWITSRRDAVIQRLEQQWSAASPGEQARRAAELDLLHLATAIGYPRAIAQATAREFGL